MGTVPSLPSDSLFQTAFDNASIGMALVSPDGKWLSVNRSVCQLLGYTEPELTRLTFQELTHPEDLDKDLEYVRDMLNGRLTRYEMEKRYFHKNGEIVFVLLSVSLVREHDGRPQFFISQIQDITARKRAEFVQEAMFCLPVALHYVAGQDGYFKRLSPSWCDLLGYTMEELLAQPFISFVHPDDVERTTREATQVRPSALFENRYRQKNGEYRWLLWASAGVQSSGLIFGVAVDYTARKEAEIALNQALREKSNLLVELGNSIAAIQTLQKGLLKVCAWTKQVQHEGKWISTEDFLTNHLQLSISHGISDSARDQVLEELRSHEL